MATLRAGSVRERKCQRAACRAERRERARGWRCPHPSRWEARWYEGSEQRAQFFDRKRDAEDWLVRRRAALQRGDAVNHDLSREPLREVAEAWFETRGHLKAKTLLGYRNILDVHVLPAFGNVPVGQITHDRVQRWVSNLEAGPGTVRNVFRVLSGTLDLAVRNRAISANPAAGVSLPRIPRQEMRFLDADQVATLAEAVAPQYRVLIYWAAYTGMRWGECAALRVKDVNLLKRSVTVSASVAEVRGGYVRETTKSDRVRSVSLPAFLAEMVAAHLAELYPDGAGPDALVFPRPDGTYLSHGVMFQTFRRAAQRALPEELHRLRFHDLRHTCASLLIANGAHPKAISERLGHSTVVITLDRYGHLLPSLDEGLTAGLNETFRRASDM